MAMQLCLTSLSPVCHRLQFAVPWSLSVTVKPHPVSGLQWTANTTGSVNVSWTSPRTDKLLFYRVVLSSQWHNANLVRNFMMPQIHQTRFPVALELPRRRESCQLVVNLLWTCYGETGVMDFGLKRLPASTSAVKQSVKVRRKCKPPSFITGAK